MNSVPAVINNSTVANAVLAGWSLTPTGLAVGDQFRLLFLSSTKRDATATDIATYNTFIQTRAAAGHTDIQAYSAGFRVVGCTAATDARDNTETTYTSTAKGVPIYWLNGAKAADEYEDFYDGSWDDEANDKNESGTDAHDTSQEANWPWTGCNHDGTEARQFAGLVSRGLGSTSTTFEVRYGRPDSSTVGHGPLGSVSQLAKTQTRPLYGLSALFQVATTVVVNNPATGAPTITGTAQVGQTLTAGTTAIMDADGLTSVSYAYQWIRVATDNTETNISGATASTHTLVAADLGTTIKVRVSFTDDASNAETLTSAATAVAAAVVVPNNPPTVATAIPDQSATAGTAFSYAFPANTFSDADTGDTLSYTATKADDTALPTWLAFAAGTRTFSGTPQAADAGTVAVKVTASDGNGGSVSDTFDITVAADTTPPTLTSVEVLAFGNILQWRFSENLNVQPGNLPPFSAFTVTADGRALTTNTVVRIPGVVDGFLLQLSSPFILQGQTVVVTYTDPTAGDDANAIQDTAGNDAATFTTGMNGVPAVTNNSTVTNTPATGAPTITGTAQVGQTLTAGTTAIMDADGLTSVSYTYQWIRTAAGVDTNISGATASTYTLVAADLGTTVKVRVSFTDDASNAETLTSAATAAVSANNPPTSSNKNLALDEDTEFTFFASDFPFTDADGNSLSSVKILSLPATDKGTLTFSGMALTSGDLPQTVPAAQFNSLKYVPPANENGGEIPFTSFTFRVNDGTDDSAATYTLTFLVYRVNDAATGQPGITGTAQVGQTLAATAGTIADVDGLPDPFLTDTNTSFQWVRVTSGTDADISGARDSTYTLVADDEGKKIKVKVSFLDTEATTNRTEGPLTSAATATVSASTNTPATGTPTITGTAQVGQTLTAGTTAIVDADGLTSVSYTYQWIRVATDNTETNISGATASTYTLVAADLGTTVKVRVSFTDDASNAETLTSAATAVVSAAANTPATGAPTITGTAQVGQTLTATVGTIADVDGLPNPFLTDANTSFQWVQVNLGTETNIASATASTYTLVREDWAASVRVKVAFQDAQGNSEGPLTSSSVIIVKPANTAATGKPGITGTAQVGQTLTATVGTSADVDGLPNPFLTDVNTSFQWIRVATDNTETNIASATASTYTLVDADLGTTIKVKVGFADNYDYDEMLTSDATAAVSAAANTPATGAPTITGTAQVGQTLTAGTTAIMDADGLTTPSYTYQWIRVATDNSETNIASATASTYTLVAADLGTTVKVRVSFTDDASNDETLTSNVSVIIARPANTAATGKPGITGTAQVGQTLTATVGTSADVDGLPNPFLTDVNTSFQWIRVATDNTETNIASATASTYTLVDADLGTTIKVKVGFADYYDYDETLTSDATAAVAASTNTPATGAPTITGTAQVGQTLTAGTTAIMDADGLTSVSYTYQWIRVATDNTETNISGATASTHTLVAADQGTTIKVTVSFTDDASNAETLTSAATAVVSAAPNTLPSASDGTVTTNEDTARTFAAADFNFLDTDPGDTLESVEIITLPASGTGTLALSGTPVTAGQEIAEADIGTLTYTPPANANGTGYASFTFKVSDGTAESAADYTMTITVTAVNDAPTVATAIPDQPATAGTAFSYAFPANTFSDADIGDTLTYAATKADGATLPAWLSFAAGTRTFSGTPQAADVGTVAVKVTASDGNGGSVSDTFDITVSAAGDTTPPTLTSATVFEGGVFINLQFSENILQSNLPSTTTFTVTAAGSAVTVYNVLLAVAPAPLNAFWILVRPTIHQGQVVVVTYTDPTAGNDAYAIQNTAGNDAATFTTGMDGVPAVTNNSITNTLATGAPTITGTAQVGQTLTADTTAIMDADGLTSVSYTYQWIRVDDNTETNISGATASTHTLVAADQGTTIKVTVSFTDDASNPETLTSAATAAVSAAANTPATGAPTITGTAQVGQTLTATVGTIADANGLPDPFLADANTSFQWVQVNLGTETNIASATASTYTLVREDWAASVRVKVAFQDAQGNSEGPLTSSSVIIVKPANTAATGKPGITGTAQVGQTLTATVGTSADVDGLPNPFLTDVNTSFQWIRVATDNTETNIASATASTYTLVTDDAGTTIKVKVGFADNYDYDEMLTSDATAVVSAAANTPATGAPTITGTAQVGQTLTAGTAAIVDADGLTSVSYTYQWIRVATDNTETNISGATASTYTLVAADLGTTIKVRVSFTDDASNAETLTSATTAVVTDTTGQTTVTFGASSYTATEGGAAATVTVALSAAPSASVTIPLTTAHLNGATAADHAGIPATVTFGTNQTVMTFTVTATDDADTDGGESVQLGFGTLPAGYAPGARRTATVTLVDNDANLIVNFGTERHTTVKVLESDTVWHRFIFSLSTSRYGPPNGNPQQPVTIPLVVTHVGGAKAEEDYEGIPKSVTFEVGQSVTDFSMRAIPDGKREPGEGLRLDFGPLPAGVRKGTWGPYETIAFVDQVLPGYTVLFGAEAYTATEGGAPARVSIHLSEPVEIEPLVVGLVVTHVGATAADYTGIPKSVRFGVGEQTQTITVTATDDTDDDDGESVTLSFVNDPNGRVRVGTGPASATVALADNDGTRRVTVSFGAVTYTATEGGADATVRVELDAAPGRSVTVPLTKAHLGNATAADYSGIPMNVTFAANQTSRTFAVMATAGDGSDGGESVSIGFGTLPEGVFAGSPAATTVTLADGGEQRLVVNFGSSRGHTVQVREGARRLRLNVLLDSSPRRPVTIPLVVTHVGGATEADYAAIPESVTFAAGQTSAHYYVRALPDEEDKTGEGLQLDFGPLPPGVRKGTWGPYETIDFLDPDPTALLPAFAAFRLLTSGNASAQDSVESDRAVLVALYNATDGPNWTGNTHWLSNEPLSEWRGVGVNDDGRVTALWLFGNQLTGEIPVELSQLSQLQLLYLSSNQLTGEIPVELSQLSQLQDLSLDSNQLTGEIPVELSQLSQLQLLYLSSNRLTGEIPAELGDLAQLNGLYLHGNELNGPIPSWLVNLTELRELSLWSNRLTGTIPPEVAPAQDRAALVVLYLQTDGPNWTDNTNWARSREPLSEWHGVSTDEQGRVEELRLSANGLNGTIGAELGVLTRLTGLYLNDNELTGTIPPELENLTQLQVFDIRNTGLCVTADSELHTWIATIQDFQGTATCGASNLVANFVNGNNGAFNSRVYLWNPSESSGDVTVRVFTLPLTGGLAQELTAAPLNLGTLGAKSALNVKVAKDILAPLGIALPYTNNEGDLTLEFTIQAVDVRGATQVFSSSLAFGTHPLQEIPSTSSGSPTVLVANFMNGNSDAFNSRAYLFNPSDSDGTVTVRVFTLPLSDGIAQELTVTPLDLGTLEARSALNLKLAEDILTPLGITTPYTTDGGNLTLEFTIEVADVRGAAQVFSSSFAFGVYPLQEIPSTSSGSPTVLVANFMNGNSDAFSSRAYLFNPSDSDGTVTVRVFTLPFSDGIAQELTGTPLDLGTLGARSALNLKLVEDILIPLGIALPYVTDGGNLTLEFTIQAADARGAAQVFSSDFAFGTYPMQEIPSTSSGSPTVLVANFMNGNDAALNSRVYLWNPSLSAGSVTVRVFTLPLTAGVAQELTTAPLDLGTLGAESARNLKLVEDILTPLGIPTPYVTDGGNLTLEFTIQAADVRGAAQVFSSSFAFGTVPLQVIQ